MEVRGDGSRAIRYLNLNLIRVLSPEPDDQPGPVTSHRSPYTVTDATLTTMKVYHHDACALHNPPYEILFGRSVPYYESPGRLQKIREALEEGGHAFEFVSAEGFDIDLDMYIRQVHGPDYLTFLRTAYQKWREAYEEEPEVGLSRLHEASFRGRLPRHHGLQTPVFPETFAHPKLLVRDIEQPNELGIIAQAGLYCFDQSCPITQGFEASLYQRSNVSLRPLIAFTV
jgi:acetoin utilization deacetylase AcuC-like enzyme